MPEALTPRKSICVFCGSSNGLDPAYSDATRRVAIEMAARKLILVYGAGDVGLMGILADAMLAAGGLVIGFIPRALVDREVAHHGITELHVVETMHERKAHMADRASAFLALPGGFGTLDELFEILTWAQLGIHRKPIGLLNVRGFFNPLLSWIDHALQEGFLRAKHRDLLLVDDDPERLVQRLVTAPEPIPVTKWVRPEER
ncbi:MAG: TIGR00730 family Rossman fold protein [Gemmataceae bacterium]